MELDTEEKIARFLFSSQDNNISNIKQFKYALYLLTNFITKNNEEENNITNQGLSLSNTNTIKSSNVNKKLNINLLNIKKIILKLCKYKKDLLKIVENNDKLFEKYTSSSCVYFKNIYYYYYALKGEDILIKPFLKNLFQDTNERLSFESEMISQEIFNSQGKMFVKRIYKFLKQSMKEKYFYSRFLDIKSEDIKILRNLNIQTNNSLINFDDLNCSLLISDNNLQEYNILSLIDSKNAIIDKVIDNSNDIINTFYRTICDRYGNIEFLRKKKVSVEDIIYNLSLFVDRTILHCLKLDNDIEEYDKKIYVPDTFLTKFIIDEFNHVLGLFNNNHNLFKLYEIIYCEESYNLPDYQTFKILKISRTPAFGIKNVTIGNEKINYTLKPIHVIFLIYTQFFADLVINDKIKSKNLLTFLDSIKYNKYFFIQNYQHFIPKLYLFNKKVSKNEENQIYIQSLSSIEITLLLYKYMGVHLNNVSLQIFDKFNLIKNVKKFDFKILLISKTNDNKAKNVFYMLCNFSKNVEKNKGKNLTLSNDSEILFNNITTLSKLPLIEINKFSNDHLKKILKSLHFNLNNKEEILNLFIPKANIIQDTQIHDIYFFYINIKRTYKETLDKRICLSKELNVLLKKLEKQSKESFKRQINKDVLNLLFLYNQKKGSIEDIIQITSVLIQTLSPYFSLRKNIRLLAVNRNINEKDSSIDTSQEKTQIEDNENSVKNVKNNDSNNIHIKKKIERKNSIQNLSKSDLKPFKSIENKNEQYFKLTNYIPSQNYKTTNTPKFPNIIKKRPTTVSSTTKTITRNDRNEIMKRTYYQSDKNNSSFSTIKNKNTNLNHSFLKRSSNDLAKNKVYAVEKEKGNNVNTVQRSSIKKGSSFTIKKEMLKNIDYLIYRSNKI